MVPLIYFSSLDAGCESLLLVTIKQPVIEKSKFIFSINIGRFGEKAFDVCIL